MVPGASVSGLYFGTSRRALLHRRPARPRSDSPTTRTARADRCRRPAERWLSPYARLRPRGPDLDRNRRALAPAANGRGEPSLATETPRPWPTCSPFPVRSSTVASSPSPSTAITQELSELDTGDLADRGVLSLTSSAFRTDDGLVLFDTSAEADRAAASSKRCVPGRTNASTRCSTRTVTSTTSAAPARSVTMKPSAAGRLRASSGTKTSRGASTATAPPTATTRPSTSASSAACAACSTAWCSARATSCRRARRGRT